MRHTFMVFLWICAGSAGIRIVALFPKRAAIRRMCRIFTAKGAAILALRRFISVSLISQAFCLFLILLGLLGLSLPVSWMLLKPIALNVISRETDGDRTRTVARPSKCGAFGRRKAAHMVPCFEVLLRRVCCILFDVYCM